MTTRDDTSGSPDTGRPDPFEGFLDPMEVVDRTDLDYEKRLRLLQDWQADLERKNAPEEQREALRGAVLALEMGSEVQGDEPEGLPPGAGYGGGETR